MMISVLIAWDKFSEVKKTKTLHKSQEALRLFKTGFRHFYYHRVCLDHGVKRDETTLKQIRDG